MTRVSGSPSGSNPMQPARESADHVRSAMDSRKLANIIGEQYLNKTGSRQWSVDAKLPLAAKADQFFRDHV